MSSEVAAKFMEYLGQRSRDVKNHPFPFKKKMEPNGGAGSKRESLEVFCLSLDLNHDFGFQ